MSDPHLWKGGRKRRIAQKEKSDCNSGVAELQPIRGALHWVFLPGESQGWGSVVGRRLWGRTESETTEVT